MKSLALWVAILLLAAGLIGCSRRVFTPRASAPAQDWPSYGNDPGNSRHSSLTEINKANVRYLRVAWVYHTGDILRGRTYWRQYRQLSTFEDTPLEIAGTLYVVTPLDRIIALDAENGHEKWAFDPKIDRNGAYGNYFTCRGLASYVNPKLRPAEACYRTIFEATLDDRLIAVDATTGHPCPNFGVRGEVSLAAGIKIGVKGEYYFTSPPAVVNGVVVVGSAINDNVRVDMPSGVVRGFDARTGKLLWAWDPIPRNPSDPARSTWINGASRTGKANVWGPISADPTRGLVFLPTTSPGVDFYGGYRKGDDRYADSVVALQASTGKLVWSFQVVHHDLWDYDLPTGPTLVEVGRKGHGIAALAQPTKMGYLFILNRETGEPVLPVEENPVPQGGVPGEWLSPTQPTPVATPPLVPERIDPKDAWGLTPWDRGACRKLIASLRDDGVYTPPSLRGTLVSPGIMGGTNWGGASFDRKRGLIVLAQTNVPTIVQLFPRAQAAVQAWLREGFDWAPMYGTPYVARYRPLLSPIGMPCNPPPWGTLAAVDASTGKVRWQVPLGTLRELARRFSAIPFSVKWGTPAVAGPLTTASGLTFIASTLDSTFRAFDTETGQDLWHATLPASGVATPMTYRARPGGRQYVVIVAGGHAGAAGTKLGDAVVAYALPK
jgi:quinoprotein glucose dehydrogenase